MTLPRSTEARLRTDSGRAQIETSVIVYGGNVTGFLSQVIKDKRREIADRKRNRPLDDLERQSLFQPTRDFRGAIHGGGIIAEIKRKSPSAITFRQDAAPERLAAIYEEGGASAISIVTDEQNFGTSLADIARIRQASSLPVVAKDFVLERYQVVEARAAGADAILLIARILSPESLSSLLDFVGELGMSGLVECHDEEDLERAVASGAGIIGINNRDLETLKVSLETTSRLVSLVPNGVRCVSESGIATRGEIETLSAAGVDAFLIGGTLLNSDAPGEKLRELLGHGAASGGARRGGVG